MNGVKNMSLYRTAVAELGVEEIAGPPSNPRIDEYLRTVGLSGDETPWCAAFVNWVLMENGLPGTKSAAARSFLNYGVEVPKGKESVGDIAVFSRGDASWQGHVGFIAKVPSPGDETICILGGNQSDKVSIAPQSMARLLGVRRPKRVSDSSIVAAGTAAVAVDAVNATLSDPVPVMPTVPSHPTLPVDTAQVPAVQDTIQDTLSATRDILPGIGVGSVKTVLSAIVVMLLVYIVLERVRKVWRTGV